uniref:Uncharacterized protein n=1 Tax=viral metagenome TaxID=1070528 RepID=A0A6C0D151_9ZZZZ
MDSLTRVSYDDLVLGKEYYVKRKGSDIMYKGMYYMHYKHYHEDDLDPLTFMNVTPNPDNKKYVEFKVSDEFYI